MPEPLPTCPDCQAGKHTACGGETWDPATDAPTPCPCQHPTHQPAEDA